MPGLVDLLDSDMESNTNFLDENSLISSVSDETSIAQSKAAAAKKPTKKRKCVTMPKKPRAKTVVKSEEEPKPRAVGTKRKAKDGNEIDEDDLVEAQTTKPRGRSNKTVETKNNGRSAAAKSTKLKTSKRKMTEEEVEEEEAIPSPVVVRSSFAQTKTSRAMPKPVAASKTKPTVRKAPKAAPRITGEVVSDAELEEEDDIVQQQPPTKRARTESRLRQEPSYRRRAGSASDTERGDPMLRRKLGDVTRKFENIDMKYRNLKDVAVSEANSNVEKLRRQCEAITDASSKLVTSLRKELAMQAPLVQEARKAKKDVQSHDTEVSKLRNANKDLSNTLSQAQTEIKSLQTKLAAARATPAPQEIKPQPPTTKAPAPVRQTATNSSENEKISQLKIDLYGDLTGLIIRGVKQGEDGDTYDCIQTGRNGTLHFKLFVDQENAKNASFEDTEFLYTPLLDVNRDRDLIETMPDYLAEDITFERQVAPKFYARVVKTLTERPAVDEEE